MKRRKTGTAQVKVKMDANGRLVQIGGDREVVKVKPSSRHGSGVGAGLGVHYLIKDASGRLVVCDNIGHVLSGTRINSIDSIDIDGRISLWRGNGIRSVSFALLIEPRKFLEGLVQYPNCTRVEVARIYPSFKSTKFTANYSLDKLIQNGLPDDTYGMILYFSRNGEVNYRLTARLSFTDRTLTLTGDDDYVAALVHWLNAR